MEQKSPNNFLELGDNAVELLKNLISIPSYSKEEDKRSEERREGKSVIIDV